MELRHYFTTLEKLGGVQSILQWHWKGDAAQGIQSRFRTFFDPPARTRDRVGSLGLRFWHNIRQIRSRFRQAGRGEADHLGVWHNLWGLHFLHDLCPTATRTVGVIHSDWPQLELTLKRAEGRLDGLLCVSRPLEELAKRCLPELARGRIRRINYPITRPARMPERPAATGRPFVIGYAGRLSKAQKRADRFPALVRELDQAGVDYRLELLGDGPEKPALEAVLREHPRVRFHGFLSGDAYWETLRGWDAMIFLSEYEGLPISMLEALSLGVLPVYPRIGTGGDEYVETLDPGLLYPRGDVRAAVAALTRLAGEAPPRHEALRRAARALTDPHSAENYFTTFRRMVQNAADLPRISRPAEKRRSRPADLVPLALLARIAPTALLR